MNANTDSRTSQFIARLTRLITRRAGWVILLLALASGAALAYAARHLSINTDPTDMISAALPFRKAEIQLRKLFPQYIDNLLIVVDGQTPEAARDAAAKLLAGIQSRKEIFKEAYLPAGGAFLESHGLLYQSPAELAALSDKMAAAQPFLALLAREPSLSGLCGLIGKATDAAAQGQSMDLDPLLTRINAGIEALHAGRPYSLSWQELMQGQPSTVNDRRQLILAQPYLDSSQLLPAAPAIEAIRELARPLLADSAHGIRVRITGDVALSHDEMASVFTGAQVASILSMIMVCATLLIGLRSWRLMFFTLLVLGAGLALTAGFAAVTIGHLNLISIAFAVLYIGLGVNYAIYLGITYRDRLEQGLGPADALRATMQEVALSLIMCAVSTAIAFYAFIPTSYAGVSELGLIAGTGMLISLVVSLTLLPALMHLWPLRRVRPKPQTADGWFIRTMFYLTPRRRALIRGFTLAISVIGLALLTRVQFNYDPLSLRDPASESIATLNNLIADETITPWSTIVLARDEQSTRDLVARLGKLPSVNYAVSLNEFVPQEQEKKLAILEELRLVLSPETLIPAATGLPAPAAQIKALDGLAGKLDGFLKGKGQGSQSGNAAFTRLNQNIRALLKTLQTAPPERQKIMLSTLQQSLLGWLPQTLTTLRTVLGATAAGPNDLPRDLRERWRSPSGIYRIEVFPKGKVNDIDSIRRFVAEVRTVAPDATGDAISSMESGNAVVRSFQQAFVGALIAIMLVLLVAMRSFRDVVLVLFPLLLAGLLTGAATVLLHISFNFASVIALPLLLGTSIENGIQIVQRMHRNTPQPGKLLGSGTARGIFYCGMTTIVSFGNLAFTAHRGLASMGQLLTMGVILALATNLLLLPAFIRPVTQPGAELEAEEALEEEEEAV